MHCADKHCDDDNECWSYWIGDDDDDGDGRGGRASRRKRYLIRLLCAKFYVGGMNIAVANPAHR